MTIIHTVILGLIEGLTEFLPVSSTGHLIIASEWLRIPQTEFLKSFEIIIQLGAILAVAVLYVNRLRKGVTLWKKVLAAFIPTAIIGYVLYKIVKTFLIGNVPVVATSLIVGGLVIIAFERWYGARQRFGKPLEDISYREAIIIGCVQSIAVIPGVSRSAATIIGGLAQGISREAIVEFSFLLAVPVIGAAAVLDIIKSPILVTGNEWGLLLLGMVVAFITALFSIKFFISFIKSHTFTWFGYYRILLGMVTLGVYFLMK
jgi:undecaprenyl-diphosphatase